MILARLERDAVFLEHRRDMRIARDGLWLVIVIGEHRVHVQRLRKLRNRVACLVIKHMQRAAHCRKRGTQLDHAFPYKFNAAICFVRQDIENFAVEYEHAMYALGVGQRGVQRSIIKRPQIAAKPEQGGGVLHSCHSASAPWRDVRRMRRSLPT